jgi:L-2-hydroxyglutarate oxidase LhgO
MVMAPYYKKQSPEKYYSNAIEIVNTIEQTAKQNNVPFFNYTSMSFANDEQYFYNMNHLNSKGAALYTQAVADSVKKYLAGN